MENEIYSDLSQKNLKNQRTNQAVAAAAELFMKNGIEEVKMTDIADASNVGVATLYRYFGTKPRIVTEVMTYLWDNINELFSGVFDSHEFLSQTGIKQLSDLMRMFHVLYSAHGDFMRLVAEFDRYSIREQIPKEELREYEQSVINFNPVVERAYRHGLEDGTVREVEDFGLFFLSYSHALLELCKKFVGGEVLPSDDFSHADMELQMLIDTAIHYLENK
ncbi:TetR/AcrR family transcriptional regulator [Ruminococcus sp.]|uniref:TetR/AcrR family transcriptional regulator n=1 Tax=Ruminococcus sp. TaxID=41978 RepID=UPI0025E4DD34|nr:TetR/AcrR family transcriptional regulator [Ruminococcus sp.]MBQ8966600.1 TetR/AcrR family transcriptional regulator [Ruminococcus sp.]